jgi:hypothetical protein
MKILPIIYVMIITEIILICVLHLNFQMMQLKIKIKIQQIKYWAQL